MVFLQLWEQNATFMMTIISFFICCIFFSSLCCIFFFALLSLLTRPLSNLSTFFTSHLSLLFSSCLIYLLLSLRHKDHILFISEPQQEHVTLTPPFTLIITPFLSSSLNLFSFSQLHRFHLFFYAPLLWLEYLVCAPSGWLLFVQIAYFSLSDDP